MVVIFGRGDLGMPGFAVGLRRFRDEAPGTIGFLRGDVLGGKCRRQLGPAIGKTIGRSVVPGANLDLEQRAGFLDVLRTGFSREAAFDVLVPDDESLADQTFLQEQLALGGARQMVVVGQGDILGLDYGPSPGIGSGLSKRHGNSLDWVSG